MDHEEIQKFWQGFPEAPVSDSCKWIDPQGYEHLTTVRAWTIPGLFDALVKLQGAIVNVDGRPINQQPKPAPVAPPAQIQERDDTGTPMVDADQNPVMINLPAGTRLYAVAALYHDQTKPKDGKPGKDVLKVITREEPYNTKYGVTSFGHGPDGWKTWPLGVENKFIPPAGFQQVVIRDPEPGGKYADVVEFR